MPIERLVYEIRAHLAIPVGISVMVIDIITMKRYFAKRL
jgi:hypothetical protein